MLLVLALLGLGWAGIAQPSLFSINILFRIIFAFFFFFLLSQLTLGAFPPTAPNHIKNQKRAKNSQKCLTPASTRDGNGADQDQIMGDPTPPRTGTTNTQPRPASVVRATYPAPLPNRPVPPRKSGYHALT